MALRGFFFITILGKKYTYIFELSSGTNFVRFFVVFLDNNYFVKRREVGDVWDVFFDDSYLYCLLRGYCFCYLFIMYYCVLLNTCYYYLIATTCRAVVAEWASLN